MRAHPGAASMGLRAPGAAGGGGGPRARAHRPAAAAAGAAARGHMARAAARGAAAMAGGCGRWRPLGTHPRPAWLHSSLPSFLVLVHASVDSGACPSLC